MSQTLVGFQETIPLIDTSLEDSEIGDEISEGWRRVGMSGRWILGAEVERFEDGFARYCGVKHCVCVASGTDAIELTLRALGISTGQRVAVPANSFVASAFAVERVGAVPVFVDVSDDFLAASADLRRVVEAGDVEFLLPVHLYGQICPLEDVLPAAREHQIPVIEDGAHAHGAMRGNTRAGAFGVAGAFSFHPSKNLGAYGDAGGVVTDSDELAQRLRLLRNHGGEIKNLHSEFGFNSRMDELQAVVLNAKLARLDTWTAARHRAANIYTELLATLDEVIAPRVVDSNAHVWHLYVCRVPRRDSVQQRMREAGIMAGSHYPIPIHLQEPYRKQGFGPGAYPRAEGIAQEVLSLPLFPGITPEQQERVVIELKKALNDSQRTG